MSASGPEDGPPHVDDDVEVVDALPVVAGEGPRQEHRPPPARTADLAPARTSATVAQAAVVATAGFAAGAVTAAVVRQVTKKRAVKAASKRGSKHGLPVVGSRSFLVDVHLLGRGD